MVISRTLSVCVVTYQNEATIRRCLDSARAAMPPGTPFVVVDNCSTDRTVAFAMDGLTPPDTLLVSDRNVGFAAAMNRAIRESNHDWILVLNPDAFLDPAFGRMLKEIRVGDSVAIVAPEISTPSGRQPTPSPLPSVWAAFLQFSGLRVFSRFLLVRRMAPFLGATIGSYLTGVDGRNPRDLAFVAGTALILRRAAFNQVGGFDESYFLYCEDADLCRALQLAGWHIKYEPSLRVEHLVGASARNFRRERIEAVEGLFWYWQKQSPARRRIVQSMAVANAALMMLSQLGNRDNSRAKRQRLADSFKWQPQDQERHRSRAASACYRRIGLVQASKFTDVP